MTKLFNAPSAAPDRLMKLREVEAMAGLAKSSIYRRIAAGEFPRPVALGPNVVRWRESEISAWLCSLRPTSAAGRGAAP